MKTIKQLRLTLLFFSLTFILISKPAKASFGVLETAEILPKGYYRVGLAPQLYLGNGGGLDTSAFLDMNVTSDISSRFELGSGVTDFWASASAKWAPYPDYENQPAMGLRGQFTYLRDNNVSFYNTQITPIISKKYQTSRGLFIPYAGVPFTLIYEKNTNNFMISKLCLGSEWEVTNAFQTGAELSLDLYNGGSAYTFTATTLSVYLNFVFDETIGFKK